MNYSIDSSRLTRAYYDRRKQASWNIGRLIKAQAEARGDKIEAGRAIRMMECSRWLEVANGIEDDEYRVIRTQACKSRLCPWCHPKCAAR